VTCSGKIPEALFPFDPLRRAKEAESLVMCDDSRLYYRFRTARYYGGIATADTLGCCFLCAYCWNYARNLDPGRFKDFFTPDEAACRLLGIARRNSLNLFRISGAEPILGEKSFDHLAEVLRCVFREKPNAAFVIETNGYFLGLRPDLIEKLRFDNLWIRICLKGIDKESFSKITGAEEKGFSYPLTALSSLEEQGIKYRPALMGALFSPRDVGRFQLRLQGLGIRAPLELESLETYPFVRKNMRERNMLPFKP